jgi:hypothetical protein
MGRSAAVLSVRQPHPGTGIVALGGPSKSLLTQRPSDDAPWGHLR